MKQVLHSSLLAASVAVFALAATNTQAASVSWDVDSDNSFIRLNISDQAVPVDGVGNVTIRLRDAGSTSQWTDNGGRRAFLGGTIASDYVDGGSIDFLEGLHTLSALQQNSFRPNPAAFNPANTNGDNPDGQYSNTTTAPAAFAARVRGTYLLTFDAAFIAFRDVLLDIESGAIALDGGGNFAGSTSNFGVTSAAIDVDGLSLPLGLGQVIPDILGASVGGIGGLNTSGGSVINLGGLDRQLNLSITVPIALDLEGIVINGSVTGQIQAYATLTAIPEPTSGLFLASLAAGAGAVVRRRRK